MRHANLDNRLNVMHNMLKLVRYGIVSAVAVSALGGSACSKDGEPFVDPSGKDTVLTDPRDQYIPPTGVATNTPTMKVSARGMQYWISVPKGWPGNRTWPIVVSITGSNKNWEAHAGLFAAHRDAANLPFIVITPVVLTLAGDAGAKRDNPAYSTLPPSTWDLVDREGRCAFDLLGIAEAISDAHLKYAGQSKAFLTGFSGGGHATWATLLLKPELLRAAAPVATNYSGRCVTSENLLNLPVSSAAERVQLPVRTFNGANDSFLQMGSQQQGNAMTLAKANGFTNFSTTVVPNVGHDPMAALVMQYFYSLLSVSEK